jgi:Flp pilus assembly pilin Flp
VSIASTIIDRARARIANALHDQQGQGLAEYALILTFVAVVAVAVIVFFGPAISSDLHSIAVDL